MKTRAFLLATLLTSSNENVDISRVIGHFCISTNPYTQFLVPFLLNCEDICTSRLQQQFQAIIARLHYTYP